MNTVHRTKHPALGLPVIEMRVIKTTCITMRHDIKLIESFY